MSCTMHYLHQPTETMRVWFMSLPSVNEQAWLCSLFFSFFILNFFPLTLGERRLQSAFSFTCLLPPERPEAFHHPEAGGQTRTVQVSKEGANL